MIKIKPLYLLFLIHIYTGLSAQHNSSNTLEDRIDLYLKNSTVNGFSGAILVAKKSNIIFSKGYGYAVKDQEYSGNNI